MKKHFLCFWCFLVDFTKISKNFKIHFFPGGIFRFFSSRLVFPEFFFSINAFLVQKESYFKILRNRPDKKKLRKSTKKTPKKRENVFSIFSSRMVFPEFFFSKNAFGPHFPPTSFPCCFSHFSLYFHDFLPFSKVLELRNRVSSQKMTFFRFHNGWDYQTHHFQQLSG